MDSRAVVNLKDWLLQRAELLHAKWLSVCQQRRMRGYCNGSWVLSLLGENVHCRALRSPGYGLTCMTKPRSSGLRNGVQASRHTGQRHTATRKDGGCDPPHGFEGLMRRPSTQWQLQQLSAQQPQQQTVS